MSRSGATAMRQMQEHTAVLTAVKEKGVLAAAMEAWLHEEAQETERAVRALTRIMLRLGVPASEPYVLDRFEDLYPPSQRVCVEVDGLIINYYAQRSKRPEGIQLLAGVCPQCRVRPMYFVIRTLSDLAYPETLAGKRYMQEFRCWKCKDGK